MQHTELKWNETGEERKESDRKKKERKNKETKKNEGAEIEFYQILKSSQSYKTISSCTRYEIYTLLKSTITVWNIFWCGEYWRKYKTK
jgi:hypothetical protein